MIMVYVRIRSELAWSTKYARACPKKEYSELIAVLVHRWEAKRIPKVKIAKVERKVLNKEQTVYMPSIPDIAACPQHLMPSKEWEDVFLDDFSNLRMVSSFLPSI